MRITAKDNDTQKRIKRWMNFYGWTLYRLQKRTNLPDSTIRGIFKDGREPSISTVRVICAAFGISLSEFFSDGEAGPEEGSEVWRVIKMWGQLDADQKDAFRRLFFVMVKDRKPKKNSKQVKKKGR